PTFTSRRSTVMTSSVPTPFPSRSGARFRPMAVSFMRRTPAPPDRLERRKQPIKTGILLQPHGVLSGGERRRLDFTMTLWGDPELVCVYQGGWTVVDGRI